MGHWTGRDESQGQVEDQNTMDQNTNTSWGIMGHWTGRGESQGQVEGIKTQKLGGKI